MKQPANENVKEKKDLRTKLKSDSINIQDLEALNEQNLRTYRFRTRRNRVIIITLAILLLLAIVGVAILFAVTHQNNNCFLYVRGADASYIVDGKEINRFRTPADIQGYRIYQFDLKLKIKSSGRYKIKCEIVVYQNNKKLDNILIYEPNSDLFVRDDTNSYESINPIDGNQTITLCQGIIIDAQYERTLNANNFKMEVTTYFENA